MGKLLAALLSLSFAAISSAEATPWATSAACTVKLPGEQPVLRLIATKNVSEEGEETSRVQVRIDAEASLLKGAGDISDARIEVPGHGEFPSLPARETRSGDTFRTVITASQADGLLPAIARGETVLIHLPNGQGSQDLEFKLIGSAVALRHLDKCLE